MNVPYYPLNDFGPVMKGMVIGGMGVLHVFVAQFAIGAGALMTWLERQNARPGAPAALERFLSSYYRFIVLVSFVVGALTGVGMWLTSIQISPRTIGLMVNEFHWVWATEWTFFCLEVAAGYAYYRYRARLGPGARQRLVGLYALAGWFSLFWVNGILAWQLTPGAWTTGGGLWAGFFNPSFWPSLVFRSVAALALGALGAAVVINALPLSRADQEELLHRVTPMLAPMLLMPLLGVWYLAVMPDNSRAWATGESVAMSLFLGLTCAASLVLGAYALVALLVQRLYINGATATLLCALAFVSTAGGEMVREGTRKPYTVRDTLYANSVTPAEVMLLRRRGSVTDDPYPLRDASDYPNDQVRLGARVFRFQCAVCHTLEGGNGLAGLMRSWTIEQRRVNVAQLQHTKPFMPPFAGPPEEVEAVVQLAGWVGAGRPSSWPQSYDPEVLAQIARHLERAGSGASGIGASPERTEAAEQPETTAMPASTDPTRAAPGNAP